jgi:hypothetical protein
MSETGPNPYQTPSVVEGSSSLVAGDVLHPPLDGQLSLTAFGLKLTYFGIILLLLSWIAMVPLGVVSSMFETGMFIEALVTYGYFGASLLAFGMINLGPFLCLTVPGGYGLRPWSIATAVGIALLWCLGLLQGSALGFPFMGTFPTVLFCLLVFSFFLAFLHRLARVIEREDLVRRCRVVFVIAAFLLVIGIGGAFSLANTMASVSAFGGLQLAWSIVVLLGSLLLFVAYANVINAIANAIRHPGMPRRKFGIL